MGTPLSKQEMKQAMKFDSTDFGWVIMSIGMAIGAGDCVFTCTSWINGNVGVFAFLHYWLSRDVFIPTAFY
ncbi:hypothetical protein [Avibacterium paragallinarum]|uniref:hypothetical protein n=1 Tax=Avibacterium paragallinarum TaxID=728 RepID=UPI001F5E1C03|nr:hypothetical protein [Avibacterium paragallinarum]